MNKLNKILVAVVVIIIALVICYFAYPTHPVTVKVEENFVKVQKVEGNPVAIAEQTWEETFPDCRTAAEEYSFREALGLFEGDDFELLEAHTLKKCIKTKKLLMSLLYDSLNRNIDTTGMTAKDQAELHKDLFSESKGILIRKYENFYNVQKKLKK